MPSTLLGFAVETVNFTFYILFFHRQLILHLNSFQFDYLCFLKLCVNVVFEFFFQFIRLFVAAKPHLLIV